MPEREVVIVNKLGLHARAAAKFVALAATFDAAVEIRRGEKCVSGKSIMGVMMLAAAKGTRLTLAAYGADAEPALDALQELVDNRFEEAE